MLFSCQKSFTSFSLFVWSVSLNTLHISENWRKLEQCSTAWMDGWLHHLKHTSVSSLAKTHHPGSKNSYSYSSRNCQNHGSLNSKKKLRSRQVSQLTQLFALFLPLNQWYTVHCLWGYRLPFNTWVYFTPTQKIQRLTRLGITWNHMLNDFKASLYIARAYWGISSWIFSHANSWQIKEEHSKYLEHGIRLVVVCVFCFVLLMKNTTSRESIRLRNWSRPYQLGVSQHDW